MLVLASVASVVPRHVAVAHQAGRALELHFTDGKKFHATAETLTAYPFGIHIFVNKPDGHIYRVFAPKATVKKCNFETQFGKRVVEHREVITEHVEPRRLNSEQTKAETIHLALGKESSVLALLPPVTNSDELKESLKPRWRLPPQHLGELLIAQQSDFGAHHQFFS